MTVKQLIAELKRMPQDAEILTNECEATSEHEEVVPMDLVYHRADGKVYIGT